MSEQGVHRTPAILVPSVDAEAPIALSKTSIDRDTVSKFAEQVLRVLADGPGLSSLTEIDTQTVAALTQEIAKVAIGRIEDANARVAEWRERQEQYAHRQQNGMHPVVSGDLEFYGIPNVPVVGIPEEIVQEGCNLYDLMDAGWVFTFGELRSFGLTDDHADRIARSIAMDSPHELAKPLMSGGTLIGKISPESKYSAEQKAAFRNSGKPNSVPVQKESAQKDV